MDLKHIVLNNIEKISFVSKIKSDYITKEFIKNLNREVLLVNEKYACSVFFDTIEDANQFFGEKHYSIVDDSVYKNSHIIIRFSSGVVNEYYYDDEEYTKKIYEDLLIKIKQGNLQIYDENKLIE